MNHPFDEFSKSLSESVPRRETLRRLGLVFAGAALSPLGLRTAWARGQDPCVAFCRCRNNKQQSQCLAICHACNSDTSRISGTCGSYVCCPTASCGGQCNDLLSDPNCGACGNDCHTQGLTCCQGHCADLEFDNANCGSCGHACSGGTPYCVAGICSACPSDFTMCGNACVDLDNDDDNCGACGNVCDAGSNCINGTCIVDDDCPPGTDFMFDANNCGGCRIQCQPLEYCSYGLCYGFP
jgi:hypothetical protein